MEFSTKIFKSNKLFFTLLGFLFVSLLAVGIISPIIEDSIYDNWDEELELRIQDIEFGVEKNYKKIENKLIRVKNKFKTVVENENEVELINKVISSENFPGFSKYHFIIQDEASNFVLWDDHPEFSNINLIKLNRNIGETEFFNGELITFLTVKDTISFAGQKCFLMVAVPVEKKYSLTNDFYIPVSYTRTLSQQFNTAFEIDYYPEALPTKDGRTYGFNLLNNFNNKIALVSFYKPFRDSELNKLRNIFGTIQSLIIVIAYLIIGIGGYSELKHLSSRFFKIGLIIVYLILFRVILLSLEIPGKFVSSSIADPAYFSSDFGFGIVSTPVELFITLFFALVFVLQGFSFVKSYYFEEKLSKNHISVYLVIGICVSLFLLTYRGFAATVRSIIFDSKFLYFDNPSLIPAFPEAFMHLNNLMFGFIVFIAALIIIILNFAIVKGRSKSESFQVFFLLFLVYQIIGVIFDSTQELPQGTPLIRILFITSVFIFYYIFISEGFFTRWHFLSIAIMGAIVTSMLLNFYNSELERESLKLYANELTENRSNWIDYKIREALSKGMSSEDVKSVFIDKQPTDADAFILWSKSDIEEVSLKSNVSFLNSNFIPLSSFSFNYDKRPGIDWQKAANINEIKTAKFVNPYNNNEVIYGIAPITVVDSILGYITISVEYGLKNILFDNKFPFLANDNSKVHLIVKNDNVKFYDFIDGEQIRSYPKSTLTENEIKKILASEFSYLNEKWLNMEINGVEHLVYAMNIEQNNRQRIFAAAIIAKEFTFSLFDFFKSFFMQMLYIIILFILMFLFGFKIRKNMFLTFRFRLFAVFLVVSIVPLVLLAGYFRSLTDTKNQTAIEYKLGKRADSIEEYVNTYLTNSVINPDVIYKKGSRDLGVNFSLFRNQELEYSSTKQLYDISMVSNRLSQKAFLMLSNENYNEVVLNEKIENYSYNSLYKKINIGGQDFIINVTDVFNPISIPMSETQLDIFLFGSYSLAVLLIIIVSTFLANQIALPIRKLTAATQSVAGGDMSLEVKANYKGEIKDLIHGFNNMVKDLKKSQAQLAEMERETAWKEMARQVAHEIKNPLTPMKLSVQQLMTAKKDEHPRFDEMFNKVTSTVIDQIEILTNIASEFSSFARMPALHLEEFNLVDKVRESVSLFSNENVEISFFTNVNKANVLADADQLKRMMINLIRNSIQAKSKKINLLISKENQNYIIRVKDDGKGIPQEVKEKIFDKNFTTKREGMGLGLNITKKFIENINGEIELEETSANGTTIKIVIPGVFSA